MAEKLREGDSIAMQGEVTRINDDGTVTVRLIGYDYAITTRGEHLSLMAKKKAERDGGRSCSTSRIRRPRSPHTADRPGQLR
jgi:hypothetical protein